MLNAALMKRGCNSLMNQGRCNTSDEVISIIENALIALRKPSCTYLISTHEPYNPNVRFYLYAVPSACLLPQKAKLKSERIENHTMPSALPAVACMQSNTVGRPVEQAQTRGPGRWSDIKTRTAKSELFPHIWFCFHSKEPTEHIIQPSDAAVQELCDSITCK
jgi:hypothetical protein